ncbi:hypothetical protein PSR1_01888 [Anaeromyxobacter sp. PSR-1]|nr:hypothetical protein PSR1_01888 [Anaeromyxobacter sp. PSR-1]
MACGDGPPGAWMASSGSACTVPGAAVPVRTASTTTTRSKPSMSSSRYSPACALVRTSTPGSGRAESRAATCSATASSRRSGLPRHRINTWFTTASWQQSLAIRPPLDRLGASGLPKRRSR